MVSMVLEQLAVLHCWYTARRLLCSHPITMMNTSFPRFGPVRFRMSYKDIEADELAQVIRKASIVKPCSILKSQRVLLKN